MKPFTRTLVAGALALLLSPTAAHAEDEKVYEGADCFELPGGASTTVPEPDPDHRWVLLVIEADGEVAEAYEDDEIEVGETYAHSSGEASRVLLCDAHDDGGSHSHGDDGHSHGDEEGAGHSHGDDDEEEDVEKLYAGIDCFELPGGEATTVPEPDPGHVWALMLIAADDEVSEAYLDIEIEVGEGYAHSSGESGYVLLCDAHLEDGGDDAAPTSGETDTDEAAGADDDATGAEADEAEADDEVTLEGDDAAAVTDDAGTDGLLIAAVVVGLIALAAGGVWWARSRS